MRASTSGRRACGSGGRARAGRLLVQQRPVGTVPRSSLGCLFTLYVCGLEMNVKRTVGIYLSVPVWLSLPEPYEAPGRGRGPVLSWSQHGVWPQMPRPDAVAGGQVRGVAPSRRKSCVRVCVTGPCQIGEDASREGGHDANCIIKSTLVRGSV